MRILLLLIILSVLEPMHADIPPLNCPSEDELVATLDSLVQEYPVVSVLRVGPETTRPFEFRYQTLTPTIRGSLQPEGKLTADACNLLTFPGDIILAFGVDSQNDLLIAHSIRIYSRQWNLVWSEGAIEWLRKQHSVDA